jgi:protein ImuB
MDGQRSKAKDSSVSEPALSVAEGCLRSECDLVTALRIFRPPVDIVVNLQDGKPAHITRIKNKEMQGEILWAAGPWRSSGDWWEKEGWARDEWDIAVQGESDIALYRLVRDRLGGRWFLEGTYD